MRARYYNVSIKWFINQDVVTGSIAESQSLNRYAYVEGNPVSYLDPFGLEKVDTSEWHGTYMAGVQGNLATGIFSLSGQIGYAQDFHGNKDIYVTFGFAVGPAVGVSGGIFTTYTNAPSIEELLGKGYNVGVSGGAPIAVGGEVNIMETENGTYYGITQSVAKGGEAEIHVGPSYTYSLTDFLMKILNKFAKEYSIKL